MSGELVAFAVAADSLNWMYTHVHVKKVKETETGGKPTPLNDAVRFKYEYGTGFTCAGVNPLELKDERFDLKRNTNFDLPF